MAITAVLALLALSCSTPRPEGKTEAEVLLKEATLLAEKGRYLLATEKLGTIRSKYPYSYHATAAELLGAQILFDQDNFVEAAQAFILFRDFHPRHREIDRVVWMIARSYDEQMPSTYDRDLTPGIQAMKYYRELMATFPESAHKAKAQERIAFIEKQLELKAQYIADFYFKTKDYESAKHRYLDILGQFKDEALRKHSQVRLLQASYFLGNKDECTTYYNRYKGEADLEGHYARCQTL